ncbi:MAG: DUF4912 domain-containing protein [Polyangiaceae bacterium]|jgi:hypothetical protein
MDRADLERLDRDALIARAEGVGVARARILTRPELVDELLLRSAVNQAEKDRSRGLFGRARDLLARVVERGLHLPDAAERIRSISMTSLPVARPSAPAALPTVTLAEIYAAQGHRQRAVETLERVLAREPDHAPARALVARLRDAAYPMPAPPLPPEDEEAILREPAAATPPPRADPSDRAELGDLPEESEVWRDVASSSDARIGANAGTADRAEPVALDDAALSARCDVDECVAIPVAEATLYVYWQVRERSFESLRAERPAGVVSIRSIVITPTWDGPRSAVRDYDVNATFGDFFIPDVPGGAVARVAVGLRDGEVFVPVAHSPALEIPEGATYPLLATSLVRWTPAGVHPVAAHDRDSSSIERAVARVRRNAAAEERVRRAPEIDRGNSERWAETPSSSAASPQTTSNG